MQARTIVRSCGQPFHEGRRVMSKVTGIAGFAADTDRNRLTGIGLFVLAVFLFSCLDATAKLASASLPTLQFVWVRFIGHLAVAVVMFLAIRGARMPRSGALGRQMLRSSLLLGATFCNFTALRYLQLAETTSIFFCVPLLVALLAQPFVGERVGLHRWLAILVGFAGILIVVRPGAGIMHWAVLFSLGASFFTAFYQIATRQLAAIDDAFTTSTLTPVVGAVILLPLMPATWQTPTTGYEWVLLGLGALFGGIGHYIFIQAHRFAPAAVLSPFMYVQIVFMTTLGYVLFDDMPDTWVFVGAGIVIASGLYLWYLELHRR